MHRDLDRRYRYVGPDGNPSGRGIETKGRDLDETGGDRDGNRRKGLDVRTREAHGTRTSLHTACYVAKRTRLDAKDVFRAREEAWDGAGASTCGWTRPGTCHQPCCDVARFVHTHEADACVPLDRFHAASAIARLHRSQANGTNEAAGDPDCAETALSRLLACLRHPTRGAGASHATSCTSPGACKETKAQASAMKGVS